MQNRFKTLVFCQLQWKINLRFLGMYMYMHVDCQKQYGCESAVIKQLLQYKAKHIGKLLNDAPEAHDYPS